MVREEGIIKKFNCITLFDFFLDGILVDLSDRNNLGTPQPLGFIGYPQPPVLPTQMPFMYPVSVKAARYKWCALILFCCFSQQILMIQTTKGAAQMEEAGVAPALFYQMQIMQTIFLMEPHFHITYHQAHQKTRKQIRLLGFVLSNNNNFVNNQHLLSLICRNLDSRRCQMLFRLMTIIYKYAK